MRGPEAGAPLGDSVPRLPHRPLLRAVRGLHLEGGLREGDRRGDRVPVRRDAADHPRARAPDGRGGRRRAVRGGGAVPEPALLRPAPSGAAGGRQAGGGDRRRRRHRDRGCERRRPGLPASRREDGRPLRVPPRERRGAGRSGATGGVRARVLRLGAVGPAADHRPARGGRHVRPGRVPLRAPWLPRRGAGRRAR